MDAKDHYNQVTDSWKKFMGDNFHFGYFENENTGLSRAADLMTEQMLRLCSVTKETNMLDVGCGIGGPALYVHEKHGCTITGISTSERGVLAANERRTGTALRDVVFKVADGIDNGLPDESFDIVWIMESSHLMANKKRLFHECDRVLRKNGTLVLCDIILLRRLRSFPREIAHHLKHRADYLRLAKTWGKARVSSLGNYCNELIGAGFREVTAINITDKTMPTMSQWKMSARQHYEEESATSSMTDIDSFVQGCDVLERFFINGILGYGMIRAAR